MPRLRSLAWNLIGWPSRMRYRRSLANRPFSLPDGKNPVLSYGGTLVPGPGGIIAGGRVKLLHLDRVYPEQENFNILYLVSSAMPPHAMELVRWAKNQGAKLVWNQNGVAFPAWAGNRLEETNGPMSALLHQADSVVYQSEFCRTSADRYLGAITAPASVLYNPVDLSTFSPATAEASSQDTWRLLTAGTHYQPGRVLAPLETLALLRQSGYPAHLTIAGQMRWQGAQQQVDEALDRLNVRQWVELRPAFTQEEAVRLYRHAHVLLHPKYHDPCPTVVIEALACGLPVVGSKSGGLPELVGADGGELIEVPLDWDHPTTPAAAAMAAAIQRIMADWPAQSTAARTRAKSLFDADQWVAAHTRIFQSLL